jgi:hypothetical protein
MPDHSPLPWSHGDSTFIWTVTGSYVIASYHIDDWTGRGERESLANAAFIITAVNSHDRLVEENARLRTFVNRVAYEPIGEADASHKQALELEARNLLEALKEQQ